jgi:hypothetical protein
VEALPGGLVNLLVPPFEFSPHPDPSPNFGDGLSFVGVFGRFRRPKTPVCKVRDGNQIISLESDLSEAIW